MNKTIQEQLNMLKTLEFQVDGEPSKEIPEFFNNIVFYKSGKKVENTSDKTIVFETYAVKKLDSFDFSDFHDKFNKGIWPPDQVMFGNIIKETEKMYYLNVTTYDKSKNWIGWIPKKSVKVTNQTV